MYSGCMLHGPGLIFNTSSMHPQAVQFGPCPLAPGACTNQDVLIRTPVDYCINEPCMQHGRCISRPDGYECHCTTRYDGKNCEVDTGPPCQSEPCKNGASCTEDNRGDYRCTCAPGYTGVHCESEISVHPLCETEPCMNSGICKVPANSNKYECECVKGFTGPKCEIDWNDCASNPCLNDGECIDEVGGFHCNCSRTGYSGTLCQNNINECSKGNPCLNGGVCFDTYGSYICTCPISFGGSNCEVLLEESNCPPGTSGPECESTIPCPRECPVDTKCVGGKCVCNPETSREYLRSWLFLLIIFWLLNN